VEVVGSNPTAPTILVFYTVWRFSSPAPLASWRTVEVRELHS
jgi:hypothetical protein